MFEYFLLLILLRWSVKAQSAIDPAMVDYCESKFQCSGMNSSACFCKHKLGYVENTNDPETFRSTIINEHNRLRQYVASGEEKDPNAGEAANMVAMNYDLELERQARCYAVRFVKGHDRCRKITLFTVNPTQSIYGFSDQAQENDEKVTQLWYNQIKNLENKDVINKWRNPRKGYDTNGFTQIVFALTQYVGCARVWNPNNPSPEWRYVIICNYAGGTPANTNAGTKVYERGAKCSKCFPGFDCNPDYNALCGLVRPTPPDVLPIILLDPDDKLDVIHKNKTSSATGINRNKIILSLAFIISLLC